MFAVNPNLKMSYVGIQVLLSKHCFLLCIHVYRAHRAHELSGLLMKQSFIL